MALPQFVCIGAQKAGTSWLYAQVKSHPDVWMPPIKELHYFNHRFVEGHTKWTSIQVQNAARRIIARHVKKSAEIDLAFIQYVAELGQRDLFSEEWYRRAFAWPGARDRMTGDITPAYSTIPEAGVAYARELLGPAKIIYLIREPLSRAVSSLKMKVSRQARPPETEAAWLRLAGDQDILDRGDYRTYIPRWKARFAERDMLFLPFGRIASEPVALLREVERFLGLGRHAYRRAGAKINAAKTPVTVPEAVVARLKERVAGQREFLVETFGQEFVRQI